VDKEDSLMICVKCQSPYGQTVNVRDGGKAEWKCRDCGSVQAWKDDEPIRLTSLRPARPARDDLPMACLYACGANWSEIRSVADAAVKKWPDREGRMQPLVLTDIEDGVLTVIESQSQGQPLVVLSIAGGPQYLAVRLTRAKAAALRDYLDIIIERQWRAGQ
jgi:hypothetical protein